MPDQSPGLDDRVENHVRELTWETVLSENYYANILFRC